jgi:hypothetical protein
MLGADRKMVIMANKVNVTINIVWFGYSIEEDERAHRPTA